MAKSGWLHDVFHTHMFASHAYKEERPTVFSSYLKHACKRTCTYLRVPLHLGGGPHDPGVFEGGVHPPSEPFVAEGEADGIKAVCGCLWIGGTRVGVSVCLCVWVGGRGFRLVTRSVSQSVLCTWKTHRCVARNCMNCSGE